MLGKLPDFPYRLKYCLKGPLSPKQPTNQAKAFVLFRFLETLLQLLSWFHLLTNKQFKTQLELHALCRDYLSAQICHNLSRQQAKKSIFFSSLLETSACPWVLLLKCQFIGPCSRALIYFFLSHLY